MRCSIDFGENFFFLFRTTRRLVSNMGCQPAASQPPDGITVRGKKAMARVHVVSKLMSL